jgi:PadR family transcriptional regulator, regulatory protein PadR
MPIRRLTDPTLRVLSELASRPGQEWYGLELCKATGLSSGSLYPILVRIEGEGWIRSRWEEPERQETEHRPRRRYYSLTADGVTGIRELAARSAARTARLRGEVGFA